jgi:hypothetical protein
MFDGRNRTEDRSTYRKCPHKLQSIVQLPVVRETCLQLRTASLCDRVVQQVVQQPHTRFDYRYNRRINLNRPTDCTTDRTVCGPLNLLDASDYTIFFLK